MKPFKSIDFTVHNQKCSFLLKIVNLYTNDVRFVTTGINTLLCEMFISEPVVPLFILEKCLIISLVQIERE